MLVFDFHNRFLFLKKLFITIPAFINGATLKRDSFNISLNLEKVKPFFNFMSGHASNRYSICTDITAVDLIGKEPRYKVVYVLMSLKYNSRFSSSVRLSELDNIESITNIFEGANWLEREVWDMFGIFFLNHPDLRRILTDYGFSGYPLRKDFPLSGYTELRYDDTQKRVLSEPIELTQDFRIFEFNTPWEGDKPLQP